MSSDPEILANLIGESGQPDTWENKERYPRGVSRERIAELEADQRRLKKFLYKLNLTAQFSTEEFFEDLSVYFSDDDPEDTPEALLCAFRRMMDAEVPNANPK